MRIHGDLLEPIPTSFQNYNFDVTDRTLGPVHVQCIAMHPLGENAPPVAVRPGTYCLDANKASLRVKVSADGVYHASYNHLVAFQDHYLATDIRIMKSGKPLLTINVEKIENLAVEDNDFTPPADA